MFIGRWFRSGRGRSIGYGAGAGHVPWKIGRSKSAGPDGYCICPNCGYRVVDYEARALCRKKLCPNCGAQMRDMRRI
jgi:hypothetical protein